MSTPCRCPSVIKIPQPESTAESKWNSVKEWSHLCCDKQWSTDPLFNFHPSVTELQFIWYHTNHQFCNPVSHTNYFVKVVPEHKVKAYWRRGTALLMLDIGTKWTYVVNYRHQPSSPGNSPQFPLNRRLVGPKSPSGNQPHIVQPSHYTNWTIVALV